LKPIRSDKPVAMEEGVALYRLNLEGVPPQVEVVAGALSSVERRFVVHLVLPPKEELTVLEGRRLLKALYRGLSEGVRDNEKWQATYRLGGEDNPKQLPWSRPGHYEAHCFWLMRAGYKTPVMGIRSHYNSKELLKAVFSDAHFNRKGTDFRVHSSWDTEAKLWWVHAENDYPTILGGLRKRGFKLKWINREGFPPAPPVAVV
jgi:hypothetical protein